MKNKIVGAFILLIFLFFFNFSISSGQAQTNPCPNTGPCDELPSIVPNGTPVTVAPVPSPAPGGNAAFDTTKSRMLTAITQVLPYYLRSIEILLVGYFWYYVPLFLGVLIGFSLLNGSHNVLSGDEPFLQWLITAGLFIALLPFTADLNADGRPGDIVGMFRYVGLELAYGHDSDGKIDDSAPLAYPVTQLKEYYNRRYAQFVQGAFTVKVPNGVLTVDKPQGFIQRIEVLYSKGYKVEDIQKNLNPAGWNMNSLFEAMNGARFAYEIVDVVLMAVQAMLDFLCRVMLPFIIIFSIDPTIRKRILSNYLWMVAITCLIFPIVHQIGRIMCYSVFNFVLFGASDKDYYFFNEQGQTIIQMQDPTTLIFVFTALSWIFVFVFGFGVPAFSYAVTSGSLFQWFTGTFSAGFTALASTSLSFATSALSGALSQRISEKRAAELREIGEFGVASNYYRGSELAKADYYGGITRANARLQGKQTQLQGQLQAGHIGSVAEFGQATGGNLINFNAARSGSLLKAMTGIRGNEIDWSKTSMGLEGKEMQGFLRAHPEIADIGAKQAGQMPVVGGLFMGDTVRTLDNIRGAFKGKLNTEELTKLDKVLQLGNDGNGNFNPQLFHNNLYNGINSAPNGAKLLSSFGLDPQKLQTEMNNGNFAGTVNALPASQVPLYNQGDNRWGGQTLGRGSSMKEKGCAVTATASALSKLSGREITPAQLDSFLDKNGGYGGKGGNSINWQVASRAAGLQSAKAPWSLQTLNKQLDHGRPVVVGIDRKPGSGGGVGGTDHWVTMTGRGTYNGREVYTANDPDGGKQIMMTPAADGQLVGVGNDYKTTGQMVTFQGGASGNRPAAAVYIPPPSGGGYGGGAVRAVNGGIRGIEKLYTNGQLNSKGIAVIETANKLGIRPVDMATIISYETNGTFDPTIRGGKGNNYVGLIQFGETERRQYKVAQNTTFEAQMRNCVAPYLQDRMRPYGGTQGADLLKVYKTINGGNPTVSGYTPDGNGTIFQHVARMQRQQEMQFGGGGVNRAPQTIVMPNLQQPQTVALPNYQPSQIPATPNMQATQQMFGGYRQQIERMSVVQQQAFAPLFAEKVGIQNERDVSNYALQAGNNNLINSAAGEVQIAQNAMLQSNHLADWKRQMVDMQNRTVYGSGMQAADIEYRGDTAAIINNHAAQARVVQNEYATGMLQQKMQYEESMEEARAQTAISIISTVGQTAAHQLEEALEKTNSRL